MPVTKNTVIRYHFINQCLTSKSKPYWSIEELIQKLNEKDITVNARTIRYDIEAMRYDQRLGYLAPIVYCKANKGYHYTNPNFSIETFTLSEEQLKSLDVVIDCLHEYQDLHFMHQFRGVIDKLAGVFAQYRNPLNTNIIEFEKAPYYKGLELRDPLAKAIRHKQVLTIHYTTFGRSFPIKHTIHPYLLKEYKNRWYLLGLLHTRQQPITLALDRINKLEPAQIPYLPNTFFSTSNYFKDFLGITCTEGQPEEIILACSASLANYIKTQHLHESQQVIKEGKNGLQIKLMLIPNYELVSLILSYGKDMQVIAPLSLRKKVKQALKENLEMYEAECSVVV